MAAAAPVVAPAVEAVTPVVEPVAQTAEPIVRAAQPVSETVTPVLEEAQPALGAAAAVADAVKPIVEATSPVLETTSVLTDRAPGAALGKTGLLGGMTQDEAPVTAAGTPTTQLEAGGVETVSSASVSPGETATAGWVMPGPSEAKSVRSERRSTVPQPSAPETLAPDMLAPAHLGPAPLERRASPEASSRTPAPSRPSAPFGVLAAVSAGVASGGSSIFAAVIAAALLLAAPGLGRWLRLGKASWPLPIPLASLERPG